MTVSIRDFLQNYNKFRMELQNLSSNPCAGFGIGKGVVMVEQIIAAGCCHGVELIVGKQLAEVLSRGPISAVELIVRVIHLVAAHHGLEATLVEGAIMRHERQAFDERFNLSPDVWKHGRILGVGLGDAVDEGVPIEVIIGFGLNKRIERVHKLAFANDDHADAAHAGALVVGSFEVYGGEGVHFLL